MPDHIAIRFLLRWNLKHLKHLKHLRFEFSSPWRKTTWVHFFLVGKKHKGKCFVCLSAPWWDGTWCAVLLAAERFFKTGSPLVWEKLDLPNSCDSVLALRALIAHCVGNPKSLLKSGSGRGNQKQNTHPLFIQLLVVRSLRINFRFLPTSWSPAFAGRVHFGMRSNSGLVLDGPKQ
jgi:hypothetical protein